MNDVSLAVSKPDEARNNEDETGPRTPLKVSEARLNPSASLATPVQHTNGSNFDRNKGEPIAEKSDSEAETVVLTGKKESRDHQAKKAIKLEEANGPEPDNARQSDDTRLLQEDKSEGKEGSREAEIRRPSLKRKRVVLEHGNGEEPDGANSSNISSTISSPVQEARSSKATDTASNRSRSSPPSDEVAHGQERKAHKKRNGIHSAQSHHGGGKSDRASGPIVGRKRRDTRSATHYDGPTHRSESPPPRNNHRAQSTQSNPPHSAVTKRKKAPAPLHVERRRKPSEDTHPESEDDSSVHSHHYLQKLTSGDNNAMSPAKMVSSKKNRDRNGRTLLARACQAGEVGEVERWLKERPQDINVPDNAGNTPMQIAALDGLTDVVRILLDAQCDIDCKNIDKDTPLIDAVENGHVEVVAMLLGAGIDPRQTNQFGKEPLDLVKPKDERADELRELLQASKREKVSLRRPSEDFNRQHSAGSRDAEIFGGAASGTSPVNSTRSPPPMGTGARRRTARSQPTDDALLWVNATPARLRDAAGKGDLTIVDHILKMSPKADTESLLAAARGGHDDVLNLMLAIAVLDPDPDPLTSGEYKQAYSTPMLAAIGRGNTNIITLLLAQPGFNPTRRLYKNMTYYELAKERQGSDWQEEYDILKEAFDSYKQHGGRKSNNNTPRKVRPRRADSSKSGSEPSSSPHEARKTRKPSTLKEDSIDGVKRDVHQSITATKNVRGDIKHRSPGPTSDLELDTFGHPKFNAKEEKAGGESEHLSKRADGAKPKRRLMSGNDFKTDQDMKRRASLAAEADLPKTKSSDSSLKREIRQRRFSDASESTTKVSSKEPLSADGVLGKKRHRLSVSPQASKSDLTANTEIKKKKRQRVNSQGNAIDQDRDRFSRPEAPALIANMIPSPPGITSPTISQGTAPVAFMGASNASPMNISPTELRPNSTIISPVNSIDQTLAQPHQEVFQLQDRGDQEMTSGEVTRQGQDRRAGENGLQELQETDKLRQAQVEQERQAELEREENERQARLLHEEEEKARLEAQRLSEEAERQIQMEREQEEARLARVKRDEELLQRRLEQERRRQESEERENMRRLKVQEDEERRRRQSLPNGLRRAAELDPEEARKAKEITKWLPLRTVTTQELDTGCEPQVAEERWIANIQAAPILAVRDLDLSQCKC